MKNILLLIFCTIALIACSDDENGYETENTPGNITATATTLFTDYLMSGPMYLPVNVGNPGIALSLDKFTYNDLSEEGTGKSAKEEKLRVTAVRKGEESDYILELDYYYPECTSCTISFTLGYEDTGTAIPVSLVCRSSVGLEVSHLEPGLTGLLTWEFKSLYKGDENMPWDIADIKKGGAHGDVSFKRSGDKYMLTLDKHFEFTPAETEQGYAIVPVQIEMARHDGKRYITLGSFTVHPSLAMEEVIIRRGTRDYKWHVDKEAAKLGIDIEDGSYAFGDRQVEYYLAAKDGCLDLVKNYKYGLIPGIGQDDNDGTTRPFIELKHLDELPAGKYELVAHVKKTRDDEGNNLYVDIRAPFVVE